MIELHPELLEAWGVQQAFANLGFDTDDLYLLFATNAVNGEPSVFVSLKRREEIEFSVLCGALSADEKEVSAQWETFINEANGMSDQEFTILRSCTKMGSFDALKHLAGGLLAKGIIPPEMEG